MGKSGPDTSGQERLQREAFTLQKEALAFQKEQALKLEKAKESEDTLAAAEKQRLIELSRKGRASTIKTIQKRPSFAEFSARAKAGAPLDIPGSVPVNQAEIETTTREALGTEFDTALKNLPITGDAPQNKPKLVLNDGKLKIGRSGTTATRESFIKANLASRTSSAVNKAQTDEAGRRKAAEAARLRAIKEEFASTPAFRRLITKNPRVIRRALQRIS